MVGGQSRGLERRQLKIYNSRWSLFGEKDATILLVAYAQVTARTTACAAIFFERLLDRKGRLTNGYTCRAEIDTSSCQRIISSPSSTEEILILHDIPYGFVANCSVFFFREKNLLLVIYYGALCLIYLHTN